MAKGPTRKQKSASRLYAVQALFQMEASKSDLTATLREFETHRFGAEVDGDTFEDGDQDLFRDIVEGAVSHQAKIDQQTDEALVNRWPIGRIDPTLRAVFRAAGGELNNADTPGRVIITEYVELARAFFPDGKEPGLVNGVLDHLIRDQFADRLAT